MTVIDLGDTRGRTTDEPPAEPPAGRRRNTVLVAVAGLTLLLAGAATPAAVPFAPLASIRAMSGDPLYVAGSTVYIAKIHDTPTAVEAYDIRTGSRRWTTPYAFDPVVGNDVEMRLSAGRLTLTSRVFGDANVISLDAATGRLRWRVGVDYAELPDGRMLVGDESRTKLSLMDPETGVMPWSVPFTGCFFTDFDGWDTAIVQCDNGRTLRLIDATTGADKATRDLAAMLPAAPAIPDEQRVFQAVRVGDTVAVAYGSDTVVWIDVLSLTDLAPGWAKPVVLDGQAFIYPCEESLCVTGPSGPLRFDPVTGTRLADTILPGDGVATDDAHAIDVLGGAGRTRPPAIVLDPRPAIPATITSGRDTLLDMYDGAYRVPIFAGAYPTWIVRAIPDGRAAYGYRFTVVGKIDGVLASACFTSRRYLACTTGVGTITFFDLPSEDRPG